MTNFPNGALVFRIWRFDGNCELLSKHQYRDHAEIFARQMAENDARSRPDDSKAWFYLVTCEFDCSAKAFDPEKALSSTTCGNEK